MTERVPSFRPSWLGTRKQQVKQYDLLRDPKIVQFYNSKAWRSLRNQVITEQPICPDCLLNGILTPSQEIHHKVPVKQDWSKRLDRTNLIALCKAHHKLADNQLKRHT